MQIQEEEEEEEALHALVESVVSTNARRERVKEKQNILHTLSRSPLEQSDR